MNSSITFQKYIQMCRMWSWKLSDYSVVIFCRSRSVGHLLSRPDNYFVYFQFVPKWRSLCSLWTMPEATLVVDFHSLPGSYLLLVSGVVFSLSLIIIIFLKSQDSKMVCHPLAARVFSSEKWKCQSGVRIWISVAICVWFKAARMTENAFVEY